MKQALALEILLDGHSALLTGPAGSGKTFVLGQFVKLARAQGKTVSITATTGLAATHLGGTTLHSWSGIGVHDQLPNNFADHLSKGRLDIIAKTDVLIIDEISMLHDYRLDMVDQVARVVRQAPDVPFGGIQVVMSGDFFQLPPVNRDDARSGGFVVTSGAWSELDPVICYLEEQHRQEDERLLDILSALRGGDVRRHHAETLLARVAPDDEPAGDVTELHTVNIDVDTINDRRLEQLAGQTKIFDQTTTGSANYVENLQRSVLAPASLQLKVGAFVMAVKNSLERRYVNGSLGRVTGFEKATGYPVVEFHSGKTVVMQPDTWELRDGDKKRASITQIPLRLAWAITVHKSQGMTLDGARIDLRRAFVEGMGYVALSRVRRLEELWLVGLNRMALRVSADALEIDELLRRRSALDAQKFAALESRKSAETLAVQSKTKAKQSWSDKIARMRQTHPNAYKPWSKSDDATLRERFQNGDSVKQLSKLLERHEGSILMRLKKHFGEDVSLPQ